MSSSEPSVSFTSATKRIQKELANTIKKAPATITVGCDNNDISKWQVNIQGPENTPYKGGQFPLEITFTGEYPFKPPVVKFKVKIFHPNIDDDGSICVAILKLDAWKPAISVLDILNEIILLLTHANPDDPLSVARAEMYVKDRVEFDKIAKEWTKKYARG